MKLNDNTGALRATNNKGLQPAMDFILEHNDDPIPDATSGATATSSTQPHSEPTGDEDAEDAEVLRAAFGRSAASEAVSDAGVEARVSRQVWRSLLLESGDPCHLFARASNVQSVERYSKILR
jgi:hypothetical protein